MQEAEIRRIMVQKYPTQNRVSGMAQGVGPQFKT
jgi:hypothetical protein